jgi:hypothetical protein
VALGLAHKAAAVMLLRQRLFSAAANGFRGAFMHQWCDIGECAFSGLPPVLICVPTKHRCTCREPLGHAAIRPAIRLRKPVGTVEASSTLWPWLRAYSTLPEATVIIPTPSGDLPTSGGGLPSSSSKAVTES